MLYSSAFVDSFIMYNYLLCCSLVDKAHLRLASAKAVLRLSRQWDHKIPVDVFHLTLRTPEVRLSRCFFPGI